MQEEVNYGSKACMKFSNEELWKYLITRFENNPAVAIRALSDDDREIEITSSTPIQFICFDGEKQDLFISFNGNQTSIFVYDEEIMFIDENTKGIYTTSDTFGNVVYEGDLRKLSHAEILSLFADFISCFIGAEKVEIIEEEATYDEENMQYKYYKPHIYKINVKNRNSDRKIKIFENITISY
ncbi:hypothetical protein J25TS5_15930 [Paenibacillus faecis]|uniref:Uncharacterized protein n=1 Tax=Paenibacillus faecis TaxID=862114 RepID=A0A5D0CYZ9_9BACL|nr:MULTISPECIES: hypothetical protein [Paenibacillus]MCA1295678.1 hypothetical protein [Paenibacillus sp. alder61]TYA15272.1 hypothetical protein FRY98_06450 [Paenibacillus faecis]GIO84661.1 hypothetical protein J25TS5_15930 [Paenibacillus faecis]